MKFAIIAAGDGLRLAQEGVTESKPLVRVRGEQLIDRLIRIFIENNATEIVVVCNVQMHDVTSHLRAIQKNGLNGVSVPLRYVVKSTPSSMHSFYELRNYLRGEPFILTTVDTIFDEDEFHNYVLSFQERVVHGVDALMGVTDYIDDEKPLYVGVDNSMRVTGYYDDMQEETRFISAGIYGLTETSLTILSSCIEKGERRMRNFQRAMVAAGLHIEAYLLTQVFDIDHVSDIEKANEVVNNHTYSCEDKVLLIQRALCYSPNSEEKDLAILQEISRLFTHSKMISEEALIDSLVSGPLSGLAESDDLLAEYNIIISMARSPMVLDYLDELEKRGVRVFNPSFGVRACQRSNVDRVMRNEGLPFPPDEGNEGYWVKRGDASAQGKDDICFCLNKDDVEKAKLAFNQRGIIDIVTQAHVKGDVVKFYGVEGTDFFRYYYSSVDTETKFGDEVRNGSPHGYSFSSSDLQADAERLSRLLQTPIYGGDAIVKEDGSYVIIDFNDFPSFSRCRIETTRAIGELLRLKTILSRNTPLKRECRNGN